MKRKGRKVFRSAQQEMRLIVFECMNEGQVPAAVAASLGLHRGWAYKVRAKASGRGCDRRALLSRKATVHLRAFTDAQERQVFAWANGKNPSQYGFDFGLWTRQVVCDLVEQRFAVRLSLACIGELLGVFVLWASKCRLYY